MRASEQDYVFLGRDSGRDGNDKHAEGRVQGNRGSSDPVMLLWSADRTRSPEEPGGPLYYYGPQCQRQDRSRDRLWREACPFAYHIEVRRPIADGHDDGVLPFVEFLEVAALMART